MSPPTLQIALSAIPQSLRDPLITQFEDALRAYRAGDWEKLGLKAGKFCEVAYCICEGHATGAYPIAPAKPNNFPEACRRLEQHNAARGRSLCIQVPKLLSALFELRNNRAIGHVGGDVTPNHMDGELFIRGVKWVMGEFVRNFNQMSLEDSIVVVESVTVKNFQVVWAEGEKRRVLAPKISASDKVLILLYAEGKPVSVTKLRAWTEYKNPTDFKNRVLRPLHKSNFIHYDETISVVAILPPGQNKIERSGLLMVDS